MPDTETAHSHIKGIKRGPREWRLGELWEGFFGKNRHPLFPGRCGLPSAVGLCGMCQPFPQVHRGPSWRALTCWRHGGWGLTESEEAQVDG